VYGLGLVSQVSGANTYYYLSDGLGSTMAMVDGSGTVVKTYGYDVYGKVTSSSGSVANEFDFAAQQTDPTGLQYLRARYYDPGTGTFISRDPLSAAPGWSGNPFGYGGGNPALLVDPTGLIPEIGSGISSGCSFVESWCWSSWLGDGEWLEAQFRADENMTYFRACRSVGEKHVCEDEFSYAEFNSYDTTEEMDALAQLAGDALLVMLGTRVPVKFSDHAPAGQRWARHLEKAGTSKGAAQWKIMVDVRRQMAAGKLAEGGGSQNFRLFVQGRLITYSAHVVNGTIRIGTAVLGVRNP
jgi:RHS repeat-associated protein